MKKNLFKMNRNSLLNSGKAILLAAILTGSAVSAQSAEKNNEGEPQNTVVRHLGNTAEGMYFRVQLDNESGERFTVTVKDSEGSVLYQETYRDKKFDKKFQVPKSADSRVVFTIRSLKTNNAETFQVDTNTRVIEEVIVTKL